jgi:hypothetical protein
MGEGIHPQDHGSKIFKQTKSGGGSGTNGDARFPGSKDPLIGVDPAQDRPGAVTPIPFRGDNIHTRNFHFFTFQYIPAFSGPEYRVT